MTTRRYFALFSKSSDSKKLEQVEIPKDRELEAHEEFKGNTSRLHRSRSGRLKEKNKQRLSIATDTYVAPAPEQAKSVPVIKMTASSIGLKSRDLTGCESARVSRTLQFPASVVDSTSRDLCSLNRKPSTVEHPEDDFIDANEVF